MPLQNQKADKMLVHWDEVVGKLRGTTRIEALQSCMWLACPRQDARVRIAIPLGLSGNGDDPGLSTSCLRTVSTASSGVNFSDCSSERAYSH
jgi:hypothetical protein